MRIEQIATSRNAKIIGTEALTWIHFDHFDREDAALLREHAKFHPLDIKDCLGEAQRSKIDVYNNYFFLVLQFPDYNSETRRLTTVEVDFFLAKDAVITIQKGRFKPLRQFFYRTKTNDKVRRDLFNASSGILLYRILDHLSTHALPAIDKLTKDTKTVENEIYSTEGGASTIRHLALLRRNILTLQRLVEPQRFVINTLVHLRRPYFTEELSIYFDDIHDRVEEQWSYVMNAREVIDGLHAVNESLVTHRTNEVIKLLTIISAILMPPTLIASIFGMNVALPTAEEKYSFLIIIVIIGALIGGALLFLKRRKWF